MPPIITYERSQTIARGYQQLILNLIQNHPVQHICEIGAGANPLLPVDFTERKTSYYTILDVSECELNKAPAAYLKVKADISLPDFVSEKSYDLIFSKMLAEHIRDAEQFHKNVYSMLSPGGLAVHFFPTLYTFPFILNRVTPEKLAYQLLSRFAPRDNYQHAKFPAYYQWCRGPHHRQLQRFQQLGYEILEYRGYFGHPRYYHKLKLIQKIHNLKTDYLLKHPHPLLTSYACTVLRKVC